MNQLISRAAYALTTRFSRAVIYGLARWDVRGAGRVPAAGPVILVANHNHLLDPPLVAASCMRRVHPMAKRELFETPLIGWYFWVYGAFPVRRFSGDMGALRVARNYLRTEEIVLMFPEGTRARGHGMRPALPGAAMVALMSKAPIVPVAITGTDQLRIPAIFFQWLLRRRPTLTVEFGHPFSPESELDSATTDARSAEQVTDMMMRRVAELLPERYQGAYGAASEGTIVVARQSREQPPAAD
ncbi:MAG: lysophospholipid acyltransferase family protein [Chloroflexi bacterium]|nr:lysophospholipid acyltransferase family protein [Chloroflexota bacterium]